MPLKIVRNDITKMNTQAIVNTANDKPTVGTGCDHAIYEAAGYEQLLAYRKEKIGEVPEGEAFITPGFHLPNQYIIHAVSPYYVDGKQGEEKKLRSCYRRSLKLAAEYRIRSIAFPLISTGGFGYPKEEGMRIAVDEINTFLMRYDILVYLVVFDEKATRLGSKLYSALESYIDENYVEEKRREEYDACAKAPDMDFAPDYSMNYSPDVSMAMRRRRRRPREIDSNLPGNRRPSAAPSIMKPYREDFDGFHREEANEAYKEACQEEDTICFAESDDYDTSVENLESSLSQRMKHMSDTFSEYLLYLIQTKGLTNADVWKRGIVDKKVFSKIKNNPDYHPNKKTALCLCMGAGLNMDETRDLLARAGYALSPCDKTDIIFSFFIEKKIYDMIELDIQLESHGLPCIIS